MNPTLPHPSKRAPRSPRRRDTPQRKTQPGSTLRFTPYAWAKLHRLCHAGETEVGGFGLTPGSSPGSSPGSFSSLGSSSPGSSASASGMEPRDFLLITDILVPKQTCSSVSVVFDDDSVADMLDEQVDRGHRPEQVLRIWCHTHPGDSPIPAPPMKRRSTAASAAATGR